MPPSPILLWLRRDLRLSDHPALHAACASGAPVIPVFIGDSGVEALGAAPKWRLGLGLEALAQSLEARSSRLIFRRGAAREVLQNLIAETGAKAVYWSRNYDPESRARDSEIKAELKASGLDAKSFGGHLLFEPWSVETKTGGMYRVYTPFWRAVQNLSPAAPLPAPAKIPGPEQWPQSEVLADWKLGAGMKRGADVALAHQQVGEAAAQNRLAWFVAERINAYPEARDFPAQDACSNLSENLSLGEISPHQCWFAAQRALHEGKHGAEVFLKELVWREFAYHLMFHTPHILTDNWRAEWDAFPWNTDATHPHVLAWKQGRTGVAFVDAAMRQMYVTGKMHNRGRMIVGSYLTKHLLTHWRIGLEWFQDCLTDWDPASNAMGWQWVAGSGPDASPYFRIFNPETQLTKFDKKDAYRARWIAEGRARPSPEALSYFAAIPRAWGLAPSDAYPAPIVDLAEGRARALGAYESRKSS